LNTEKASEGSLCHKTMLFNGLSDVVKNQHAMSLFPDIALIRGFSTQRGNRDTHNREERKEDRSFSHG
jgi:hypothetical protein